MFERVEPEYYGLAQDPWPFEYVIQGLQFFAMDEDALLAYLPPEFPETLFHGSVADFFSSNPLVALASIFRDCIGPGRDWNSWIENPRDENEALPAQFVAMLERIDGLLLALDSSLAPQEALRTESVQSLAHDIRLRARSVLAMIDWYEPDPKPHRTALSVLDEWSYGDCSENISRQAGRDSSA